MGLFSWLRRWRPKVREFADTYVMSRSQLNQNLVRWLPDHRRASLTLLLAHHPETFLQLQDLCNQQQVDYRIHDSKIDRNLVQQAMEGSRSTAELAPGSAPSQRKWTMPATTYQPAIALRSPVILGLVQQLDISESGSPTRATTRSARQLDTATGPVSANGKPALERKTSAPIEADNAPIQVRKLAVLVAERHMRRAEDNRVVQFLKRLDHPSELAFFLAFDDPLLGPNIDVTVLQLLEHYGMRPDEPLQSQLLERLVRRVQRQHERQSG